MPPAARQKQEFNRGIILMQKVWGMEGELGQGVAHSYGMISRELDVIDTRAHRHAAQWGPLMCFSRCVMVVLSIYFEIITDNLCYMRLNS